jgi:TDG/mug DNA glycosylase family protein
MGDDVLTLADLIPDEPRALVVGINPAPRSVAAGHYYQGTQGQRLFSRLRHAGLLTAQDGEWEDDAAVAAGIGFTDIVKRPTPSSAELRREEYEHGKARLRDLLEAAGAPWVIFAFKETAKRVFGKFDGNGHMPAFRMGASHVFVMPGPYESSATSAERLRELNALIAG